MAMHVQQAEWKGLRLVVSLILLAGLSFGLSVPTHGGPQSADAELTRLVVGPEGNEVRFRVREQLARISFPNDAVGSTRRIRGQIVFGPDGKVLSEESSFTVDLTTLYTDQERRDNQIRRNILQTETHPTCILVPKEIQGLSIPLPTSGERTFELTGDLTLREITRPTTWTVTARFTPEGITGTAKTSFPFGHFELQIPRVASVLSVQDEIKLEYDFLLVLMPVETP